MLEISTFGSVLSLSLSVFFLHSFHFFPLSLFFFSPHPDSEIRNIIDKLAMFVARNGPEFEQMTMEKQRANLKFQFLFGGEHHPYYRWKVSTEQAGTVLAS